MDKKRVILVCGTAGTGHLNSQVAYMLQEQGYVMSNYDHMIKLGKRGANKMPTLPVFDFTLMENRLEPMPLLHNTGTLVVPKNHKLTDAAHPQPFYRKGRW